MESESNQAPAAAAKAAPLAKGGAFVAVIAALFGLGYWAFGGKPQEAVKPIETAQPVTQAPLGEAAAAVQEPPTEDAAQEVPPQAEAEAVAAAVEPAAVEPVIEDAPIVAPSITTWAVSQKGDATIAGFAAAGSKVEVLVKDKVVAEAIATRSGEFAVVTTLEASDEPAMMSLRMTLPDGQVISSHEGVAIAPIGGEAAPAAVLVSQEGAVVLQGASPEELSITAVSYGDGGAALASGFAPDKSLLRVYLDNALVAEVTAEAGQWQLGLPEVAAGDHSLRVDLMGEGGAVAKRVEQSFTREAAIEPPAPEGVTATTEDSIILPARVTITVEKGHSLWAIAQQQLGSGVLYVQVFEANRDKILDADLIYPGQVIELPTR